MKHSPRLAILQSLDSMDHIQMENVLQYIKGILQQPDHLGYQNFKKEAMKEIRNALKQNRRSKNLQFV